MSAEIHPFHESALAAYNRIAARADTVAHGIFCEARSRFPDGTRRVRQDLRTLLSLLDQVDKVAGQLERIAELEEGAGE